MPFVLDNPVVSGWTVESRATPYTEAIARRLERDRALVPPIRELEFTNVLRTACTRGRLQAHVARAMVEQVMSLPIDVDREPVRPAEVLALALRFGLSAYDAAYLELALRRQVPIATSDEALADAATASGAGWLAP